MQNTTTYTAAQQQAVAAIYNKYKNVEGDYSSTMLDGIVHGNCDSGILTDGLSLADGALLCKYNLRELANDEGLYAVNDIIIAKTKKQLLCCKVTDLLAQINSDVEDVAMFMYITHMQ